MQKGMYNSNVDSLGVCASFHITVFSFFSLFLMGLNWTKHIIPKIYFTDDRLTSKQQMTRYVKLYICREATRPLCTIEFFSGTNK